MNNGESLTLRNTLFFCVGPHKLPDRETRPAAPLPSAANILRFPDVGSGPEHTQTVKVEGEFPNRAYCLLLCREF